MNQRRMVLRLLTTFVLILPTIACFRATESKGDGPEKGKKAPGADSMLGEKAGQVRDDNGMKMKFVWCPPGEFKMGSPNSEADRNKYNEDQVTVNLTKGYWLATLPVTQSEWKKVMASEPWKKNLFTKNGDNFPVTYITWDNAMEFCQKFTNEERTAGRLPAGWEYTLPTDAQWERACRAGTDTKFSFGNDETKLGEYAWFGGNAGSIGEKYAHEVGQKKTNPWGLHDMHGNVKVWCRDVFKNKLLGGNDPEVTEKPSNRVIRGGGWGDPASDCRSARRAAGSKSGGHDLGLRVALCQSDKQ